MESTNRREVGHLLTAAASAFWTPLDQKKPGTLEQALDEADATESIMEN